MGGVDVGKAEQAILDGLELTQEQAALDEPALEHRVHVGEIAVEAAEDLRQRLRVEIVRMRSVSGMMSRSASIVVARHPMRTAVAPPVKKTPPSASGSAPRARMKR